MSVSIHAARVGRDTVGVGPDTPNTVFQSTRPVWAATAYILRLRCDSRCFNPRGPCGPRQA